MMRRFGFWAPTAALALTILGTLGALSPRRTDAQRVRGTLTVGAEVGGRTFPLAPSDRELGKFLEYRDVPSGALVERLAIGWTAADSTRSVGAYGTHLGQADQQATLRATDPGRWDVQLKWDRVPHLFSTTARSFGNFESPSVLTLPTPRPDTIAWASSAPAIAPIRTRWDAVRGVAVFTPSERWDFRAELADIGKRGGRPLGIAFGSPGNNFREIPEPIDQRQRDLRLSQSFQSAGWQMVAMYAYSAFENAYDAVTSDNPLVAIDTRTAGSAQGRAALAPPNSAHQGAVTIAGSLPFRTRISAQAMYSAWRQDAPFIPATINTQITDVRLDSLPKSLDGRTGTAQWYVSVSSRPFSTVSVNARAREFRYRDDTELEHIPVRIVNDRSVSGAAEREPFGYNRKQGDLSASWRLERTVGWPIVLGAGWGWDHWVRGPHRNVYRTTDYAPRLTADVEFSEYASLHASYATARRRASDPYIQNTTSDAPDHRRFDQANRDRARTNLIVSAYPIPSVMLAGSWSLGADEYPDSPYGTQSDRTMMYGVDGSWALATRFSVWGGYARETFLTRFRSRYRTTGQLNNPTYDWVANNVDAVNTLNAGFRFAIIPDRLEVGGQMDQSNSTYQMRTFNPSPPSGGTATQNFAATASDLPTISYSWQPFSVFVTYQHNADWSTSLRFQGDTYDQNDFRSLGLLPYEGGGVFLAHDYLSYNARWLTVTFSYRPRLLKTLRSAL